MLLTSRYNRQYETLGMTAVTVSVVGYHRRPLQEGSD